MNREIYAAEVRVIDEEGKMLGVYTVPQAIQLAESRALDLIEIVPNANPPTCKIMDFGKWKYENKKKQTAARKNQVVVDTKEVQLRPRTEQHDLETKVRHARRFLLDGDKVKVNLRFSGREMSHQETGLLVLKKFSEMLKDLALVEVPSKKEGRQVFILFGPDPVKIKEFKKNGGELDALPGTTIGSSETGSVSSSSPAGASQAQARTQAN